MPLKKIAFKSGVNRENTRYTTEGGWYDCDKIRFRYGTPEKIGGWEPVSYDTYLGVARSLTPWELYIGVGTNLKYYISYGGGFFDFGLFTGGTTRGTSFSANHVPYCQKVGDQ